MYYFPLRPFFADLASYLEEVKIRQFEKLRTKLSGSTFTYNSRGILQTMMNCNTIDNLVCCGVRGRALASHTDVRGFEPQCGGRLSSLTC